MANSNEINNSLQQESIYCMLQSHVRSKKQLDDDFTRFDNYDNTAEDRECKRCKIDYRVEMDSNGVPKSLDENNLCKFHSGSVKYLNDDFHYTCCNVNPYRDRDIKPCAAHNYHISENPDFFKTGIVSSASSSGSNTTVYALECELCATVNGYECCRVILVDEEDKVVYESLVKPEDFIIDYKTDFSGITKEIMENGPSKSLKEVQNDLLKFIKEDTILMGFCINDELTSLKLHHDKLINTAEVIESRRPFGRHSLRELAKNVIVLESMGEEYTEIRREREKDASCSCLSWRVFKTICN